MVNPGDLRNRRCLCVPAELGRMHEVVHYNATSDAVANSRFTGHS
jgi:hypothetical protein